MDTEQDDQEHDTLRADNLWAGALKYIGSWDNKNKALKVKKYNYERDIFIAAADTA